MRVSIIICTRDRAEDLRQTLTIMARVRVPDDMPAELLVVDNASVDHTADVARSCMLPNMPVRYVYEPRRGKGYAYNTGMAEARGEVFLFTDDDVRPPLDWIEGMCRPILEGEADAVAGGVRIAPHLERTWMKPMHRSWMASTECIPHDSPELIGANMAFSRKVLSKIPGFDPELGPGALGFGDDTLLASQLLVAGFTLVSKFDVVAEHHFHVSRLSRDSLLTRSKSAGRTSAFLQYHWDHRIIPLPRLRLLKLYIKLLYLSSTAGLRHRSTEGIPLWESQLVSGIYFYKQYLRERKRQFKY
jgi:glycosyltransferase involved in cell wall biosynthesis